MFVPASATSVYEKQDQCEHWSPSNWDKRLPSLCFGSPWLDLCRCVVEGWLQSASCHQHPLRACCEAEGGLGALAGHAVFPGGLRRLRQSRAHEEPCAAPGIVALAWFMGPGQAAGSVPWAVNAPAGRGLSTSLQGMRSLALENKEQPLSSPSL